MKKWLLLGLIIFTTVSCQKKIETRQALKTLVHENGLMVKFPQSILSMSQTAEGFKFFLTESDARQSNEIQVKRLKEFSGQLDSFTEKELSGFKYFVKEDSFTGGSGGTEFYLTIWKPISDAGILLEQYVQMDTEPTYDEAWQIIEHSSIE